MQQLAGFDLVDTARSLAARWLDGVQSALPLWQSGHHEQANAWQHAAQQLQQSHQSLLKAGRPAPARLVLAMEHAVRRIADDADLRSVENATLVHQASVALRSYLDHTPASCPEDAAKLYPVYQPVAQLAQWSKAKPADLWACHPWRWLTLPVQAVPADVPDMHAAALTFFETQNATDLIAVAHHASQQAQIDAWQAAWQLLAAALEVHQVGACEHPQLLQRAVAGVVGACALRETKKDYQERLQHAAHTCLYLVAQGVQLPQAQQATWARAVATRHGVLPAAVTEPASVEPVQQPAALPVLAVAEPQVPHLNPQEYLDSSERLLQALHAVLRQWQARPDNEGAGQEASRILQEMRHLTQEAADTAMQPVVQEALSEVTLQRVRIDTENVEFQTILQAVDRIQGQLPQKQAA